MASPSAVTEHQVGSSPRSCFPSFSCPENWKNAATRVKEFFADNGVSILQQSVAWGLVISGVGLLYGFKATALPLTIGLGCGVGIGLISGVVMACWIDPYKKDKDPPLQFPGKNTLWYVINNWFNSLPRNGTQAILLSVAVTVTIATIVVFPQAGGVILGLVIGNHLVTGFIHALQGKRPEKPQKTPEEEISELKTTISDFSKRLAELERNLQKA